ncbi:hypothetical protein [Janthinobacterium fluminis]|uniref:Uncharacterized protein n=1 Tax=Janthinobacterium fluminis TaxID=2987524 RepID=A0ABT5JY16_9BURK|nr:hypothetical protein [Janthinobacterium fluminis]MDC8757607.1 hypothetical protein [Janthinobacterium fluminis]
MNLLQKKLAAYAPPLGRLPAPGSLLRRLPRRPRFSLVLGVLAALLLAAFLGAVIALGSNQLTIVLAGVLIVVPVIFLVSTKDLLPLLFVYLLLVQGIGGSFFHLRLTTWMGSGFAFFFLCRTLMELSNFQRLRQTRARTGTGSGYVLAAAALYLLFFFFGLAIGHATTAQVISALRFGVPMFGVLLAMYSFELSQARINLLWTLILVACVCQVPVATYQHFFMMAVIGWDAVVGTFGIGMSPVLVLFSIISMTYAIARWMRGLMPVWLLAAILLVGMVNILLGEVKAVLFWLPLSFFLIMRKRVLKNVFAFLAYGFFLFVFVVGTFLAYKALYWGESGTSGNTLEEKLNHTGGYFFDPHEIKYSNGEISRGASLYLWYKDPVPGVLERLVGYGPGASATSDGTGMGVVAARYRPLRVNATALAALLWDVGILGTLSFAAMLLYGIVAARRYLARGQGTPEQDAIIDTSLVTLVLLMSTLIYNRNLVDELSVQLLCFFCLGCIVQLSRFGAAAAPAAATPARAGAGAVMKQTEYV